MLNMYDFRKVSSERGDAPARAGLAPMVFEHDSFRRGGQGELYLVQRRRRKKPEDAQRDNEREAEVASLRSRITELERRLSQLELKLCGNQSFAAPRHRRDVLDFNTGWRTRSCGAATTRSSSREGSPTRATPTTRPICSYPLTSLPPPGAAPALISMSHKQIIKKKQPCPP